MEQVVLVNEQDDVVGLMEKLEAHQKGVLHRAFSVFIFNEKGELLLQQRAAEKYHSPLLWTNTCCSHPYENETYLEGAQRRLKEEMGLSVPLEYKFHFIYKADVGQGLTEHELDHVFVGYTNNAPSINFEEVHAYRWISLTDLQNDIIKEPSKYTEWFKIILHEYLEHL